MRLFSLVLGFAVASVSFGWGEAESFCSSELMASFKMLSAERGEAAKDALIQEHRDEVLSRITGGPYPLASQVLLEAMHLPYEESKTFLKKYVTDLESKVDWKDGKRDLIATLRSVIQDARGTEDRKKELSTLVSEDSLIPFSEFLKTFDGLKEKEGRQQEHLLAMACGYDALMPGGIATTIQGKRVFTFCPGATLRASVEIRNGKPEWLAAVRPDALLFTAFHELGHLLGAEHGTSLRAMHDDLMSCLNTAHAPFPRSQEAEVLADFWGAVGLAASIRERKLSEEETTDFVALNLSALKNGGFGSNAHPAFGARQQVVLGHICTNLLGVQKSGGECRLNLSAGGK